MKEDDDESEEESDEGDEDSGQVPSTESINKPSLVASDIGVLRDIFAYMDRTSARISTTIQTRQRISDLESALDRARIPAEAEKRHVIDTEARPIQSDDLVSLSFSQYEGLDDAQRAQLLEKAIGALTSPSRPQGKGRSK